MYNKTKLPMLDWDANTCPNCGIEVYTGDRITDENDQLIFTCGSCKKQYKVESSVSN